MRRQAETRGRDSTEGGRKKGRREKAAERERASMRRRRETVWVLFVWKGEGRRWSAGGLGRGEGTGRDEREQKVRVLERVERDPRHEREDETVEDCSMVINLVSPYLPLIAKKEKRRTSISLDNPPNAPPRPSSDSDLPRSDGENVLPLGVFALDRGEVVEEVRAEGAVGEARVSRWLRNSGSGWSIESLEERGREVR